LQLLQKIAAFKRTGLYGDQAKSAPFERLAPLLQDKSIIAITSRVLLQAKKITAVGRSRSYKNPTRVFLSSFLIAHHTSEIMPDFGETEQHVKECAIKMLQLFDLIIDGNMEKVAEFLEVWNDYHVAFEEWKAADTERILNYMYDHFMQLEKLRESVQSEPGANAEWNPQIEMQQKVIKDKVIRIGGKSALTRFLAGQKQFRDMSDGSDAEVMSDSSPSKRRPDSVKNSRYGDTPLESPLPPTTDEKPNVALNEVLNEFGSFMTNEKMAHELIMNPDFELTVNPNSLEAQIRNVAKRAFFDKIRQDIAEQQMTWVPGIIQDVRTQLVDMLPERSKVRAEIMEALDVELISQQVERGSLDIDRYIAFVVAKMLQLCAPIRDAAIRQIENAPDIVSKIEDILSTLDDMKLDLANFKLRSLRPHLLAQAVEYERSKFSHALQAGAVGLELTRKWLSGAVNNMNNKAASRNPENIDHPENRIRYDETYFDALMSLIFNPEQHVPNEMAETLRLDAERIFGFQNESRAITVVAALIMLTRNFVAEVRDDSTFQNALKKELLLLLQEPHTTSQHLALHIITSLNGVLARSKRCLAEEQENMIKSMVEKTLTFKDTVYSLLNRRISQSIRSHLMSGRFRRDSNSGLEIVQQELDELSEKIFLLARHNRDVFAPWYDEILREIVA
jgi:hypothetical protein